MNSPARRRGFSLIELLTGIAIAAIVAGFAVQTYHKHQLRTRLLDGQLRLLETAQLQQRHFSEHLRYTTALEEDLKLSAENGAVPSDAGFYLITAAACGGGEEHCVRLTASPREDADGLPALTLDTYGRRTPAAVW